MKWKIYVRVEFSSVPDLRAAEALFLIVGLICDSFQSRACVCFVWKSNALISVWKYMVTGPNHMFWISFHVCAVNGRPHTFFEDLQMDDWFVWILVHCVLHCDSFISHVLLSPFEASLELRSATSGKSQARFPLNQLYSHILKSSSNYLFYTCAGVSVPPTLASLGSRFSWRFTGLTVKKLED